MRQRGSAEAGGDVVTGSLSDACSLAAAMAGVRAVFAYTIPPSMPASKPKSPRQGRSSPPRRWHASRIPRLVFSSVAGTDQTSEVPHFESRALIEAEHERVPLSAVSNPDMHAKWAFFNREGYSVDIPALHRDHPEIGWTRYADWAGRAWTAAR